MAEVSICKLFFWSIGYHRCQRGYIVGQMVAIQEAIKFCPRSEKGCTGCGVAPMQKNGVDCLTSKKPNIRSLEKTHVFVRKLFWRQNKRKVRPTSRNNSKLAIKCGCTTHNEVMTGLQVLTKIGKDHNPSLRI